MKKALILMLTCLLLCGCDAGDNGITNVSSLTPPTERPADLRGLSTSDAAVKAFPVCLENVYAIRSMGNQVLVFSGAENTTLTLLSAEDLSPSASYTLDGWLDHRDSSIQITDSTISCYLPDRRETLLLDSNLQELRHIPDPAILTGPPLFHHGQNTLYYCTDNAIFAWDMDRNIHRTLKELSYTHQELVGMFLEGTVLQCRILDGSREEHLFLSAQNGKMFHTHPGNISLEAFHKKYYAQFPNGSIQSLVFGSDTKMPQALILSDLHAVCNFLPQQNSALICTRPSEDTLELTVYHLDSGSRTASLIFPAQSEPIAADGCSDGFVYLLCADPQSGQTNIYRWDCRTANLRDTFCYTQPHYTRKSPDREGLENCRAYAEQLSEKFGIRILVGKDAAATQPWDYDLEPEHLVSVLTDGLKTLDRCLSTFPPHMLTDTASHFSSLRICLVRQICGSAESGSTEPAAGIQFLENSDAYIALALGPSVESSLYHELFHVMDTHLLGNTGTLDRWDELNPAGFRYDYSYETNKTRNSGVYLQHDTRAFVDTYSMSYPKEDKARIMEYAMLPGNLELFQNPTMQRKLRTLCEGIRDAYGLSKEEITYPWEQYLE